LDDDFDDMLDDEVETIREAAAEPSESAGPAETPKPAEVNTSMENEEGASDNVASQSADSSVPVSDEPEDALPPR
jgi:hypothetical protein